MTRAEWLAARREGIGGSQIGALAGLNPYSGPLDVFNEIVLGLEKQPTWPMRRGLGLEGALAERYVELTGRPLMIPDPPLRRHHAMPIVLGTPDRFIAADKAILGRIVEFKAPGLRQQSRWGEEGTDAVPHEVRAQVTWYCGIEGLPGADVFADLGGDEPALYHVPYDPESFGLLFEVALRFWRDHVITQVPPPLDASDAAADYLRARFPRVLTEQLVAATPEIEELAADLFAVRAMRGQNERREDELKHLLEAFIGDAAGVQGNGWRATWTEREGSPRWKEIALARGEVPPELIDAHLGAPSRTLRMRNGGGR